MRTPGLGQLLTGLNNVAKRGNVVSSITGGSYGATGYFPQQGTSYGGINWNEACSLRFNNSIVFAVIAFAVRQLESIPLNTYKKQQNGNFRLIPEHPCTVLMERPNPWYDGGDLLQLQVFTEMAWGQSFAYKHRNPFTGELIALEFLPENSCYPYTWPGSGEFISEYRVSTVNGYFRVPPVDILHMRYMMDPTWPVYGMSPLFAAIPELASDILAARHEAAILANGAVASALVSPKQYPSGSDSSPMPLFEWGGDQAKQLEQRFASQLTKDAKGGVMVTTLPMNVEKLQFDPDALKLEYTTGKAEQRICAGFGIQPVAVGLGSGLRESNNRASLKGAIEFTFTNFVIPYARRRARQLTRWLIPELGSPGQILMYDESKIETLKDIILSELVELTGVPNLTLNEGRAKVGYPPVEGGDSIMVSKGTKPLDITIRESEAGIQNMSEDPRTEIVDKGDGKKEAGKGSGINDDGSDPGG